MTNPIALTESELVLLAKRGSKEAFDRLVGRCTPALQSFARRFLRNPDEAADAVQVTWVKAHRSLAEFDTSRPFRPWLYRICANVCRDIARRTHKEESLDDVSYKMESPCHLEEGLEANEVKRTILRAILKLPKKYRKIFALRHYGQMEVGEIAQKLGTPEGTIKSWLFRARALLRKELAEVMA
ncbi:MAG TPA: RNA polymerase sigma factor [Fimbriimonadales bacterium]|nr:RNA polymerase sigma factor [Fimbriimonadales bacterium]